MKILKSQQQPSPSLLSASALAHQIRAQFPTSTASEIAKACGIAIIYETLPLVFGQIGYLAEASMQPPGITLNPTAIAKLTEYAEQAPAEYRCWFTATAITEVIIAHELYHILANQPSDLPAENAAHEFVQILMRLPFSPRYYETALRRLKN